MNIFKKATEYSVHEGKHISSYELSVADIISYLIVGHHVCDNAVVNIHSPSEGYAQSNRSHLELQKTAMISAQNPTIQSC